MDLDRLMSHLGNFMEKTKTSAAQTPHWSATKDAIRKAYDAGTINAEQMKELNNKVTFNFKNQGRAIDSLQDLPAMAAEKGGSAKYLDDVLAEKRFAKIKNAMAGVGEEAPALAKETSLLKNASGFAKVAPMMGMAALGLGGLQAAKKAQEGDYKGAALQAADTGSYAVPMLGEARMAADLGSALGKGAAGAYKSATAPKSVFQDELDASESHGGELPQDVEAEQSKFNMLKKKLAQQ